MFDQYGRRKYLNRRERRACLRAFEAEADPVLRAFALTLLHTGCRISEALALSLPRVDFSDKCVVFETLKRRKRGVYRAVPVPDSLIKLLRQITEKGNSGSRIWGFSRVTAYRYIKQQMREAGIEGPMACPKGLRHGFAVACVALNIPLTTLQKWMGHARLETTAIYLSVFGEEERHFARRLWSGLKC